jgi:hypothetical protein
MKFGMAVVTVFVSFAIVNASAAAAFAAQTSRTPAGKDVSYPQCGKTLPSGQAFGIVGVNDGLANNTNPCLAAEIAWAMTSSGITSQPKVSLYVNTANPGNLGVADWPVNNNDPVTGKPVSDPYGTCAGGDDQACAWQYGWNMADLDARSRGVSGPGSYRWWLDVETANSWESSTPNNRADLEGMAAYFQGVGGTVGIYSTTSQWGKIAGTVPSASALFSLPDWIAGARTLSQAKTNCGSAPLTGGGIVTVTQWVTSLADSDFSCR